MKMKSEPFAKIGFLVKAALFFWIYSSLGGCSDPSELLGPLSVSESFDETGGVISLGETIHLFIPEGSLSTPVSFELEEITSPAPPPEGWVQVGLVFEARPGVSGLGDMLSLGFEFPGVWSNDLVGRRVRISRFDETGRWVAVPSSGSVFPECLWGAVYVLGIFTVHVENSSGFEDNVVVEVSLSSRHVAPSFWATEAVSQFFNFDMTLGLSGTGGPVSIGGFSLDLDDDNIFSYFSDSHEIQPNTNYAINSPGGEEVPPFQDSVKSLRRELVLSNPAGLIFDFGKQDTFSIVWSGGGPEWIWLGISGEGVDGTLVKKKVFVPNAGEYVFSSEEISLFKPGTEMLISAKLTQVKEISSEGFHSRSFCKMESSSRIGIMLR